MSFLVLLNRGIVAELIYGPGAHHQVGDPDLLLHVDEPTLIYSLPLLGSKNKIYQQCVR